MCQPKAAAPSRIKLSELLENAFFAYENVEHVNGTFVTDAVTNATVKVPSR